VGKSTAVTYDLAHSQGSDFLVLWPVATTTPLVASRGNDHV